MERPQGYVEEGHVERVELYAPMSGQQPDHQHDHPQQLLEFGKAPEGFVSFQLSEDHHHAPHLPRSPAPLYTFGVIQAGVKSNKDFTLHLRCASSLTLQQGPVRVAYRLCRARSESPRDGWDRCSPQECSALELVVAAAGPKKKKTTLSRSAGAAGVKLEQRLSELSLASADGGDDGAVVIELEQDGTKSLRFRLRERLRGVYCVAFELVGAGAGVAVLYGPPMAMVANTGITRPDMREAAGDVLRYVFLDSADAAAADPNTHLASITRFISAACESFKEIRPFRDSDDASSAYQHVPANKRTDVAALFDQLFAAAWIVVTKLCTTKTLRDLWAHQGCPKLIEGYLTHPEAIKDISDKAKEHLENQPPGSFMLRLSSEGVLTISFIPKLGGSGLTHSRLMFAANTVKEEKKQHSYASLRTLLLDAESLTHLVTLCWSSRQSNLAQYRLTDKTHAFANDATDDDLSSPQKSGKKKSKKTDSANSYGTTSSSTEATQCIELLRSQLASAIDQCELLRSQLTSRDYEVYNLKLENLQLRDALFGQPDDLPLIAGSDQPPAAGDECVVEACGQAPLPQGSGSGKRRWEGDNDDEAEADADVVPMDHAGDQLDFDTNAFFNPEAFPSFDPDNQV